MTVGERIRQKRIELELSQDELAKRVNYKSRSSIQKIECARDLPLNKVELMAKALGCTPSYLMGWEDEDGELTLLGRVGTSYIKGNFLSTVTDDEIEILARLRSIPEKDKARVLDLLDSYYQEYKDEKKESSLA